LANARGIVLTRSGNATPTACKTYTRRADWYFVQLAARAADASWNGERFGEPLAEQRGILDRDHADRCS
jgi:hypothetical protein